MYAPVVTRFLTYDVQISPSLAAYAKRVIALPEMQEWVEAARQEVILREGIEGRFDVRVGKTCLQADFLKLRLQDRARGGRGTQWARSLFDRKCCRG